MKKTINIWLVLLIALLFTGCTETMLPEENMDKTEQFLEPEIQEEVKREDILESIDYEEKYGAVNQMEDIAEDTEIITVTLSEEQLAHVQMELEDYYISINCKLLSYVRATPSCSFIREYEGYEANEVVVFEVSVDNSENKRYIAIGSKDGWNNCIILNEGY